MSTTANNPNNSRLIWITILANLGLGLLYVIGWIIQPNNFSDLIRGGSIGAICLIIITLGATVMGGFLFWKAYQKGMMSNLFDIIIYAVLPVFAFFIFISLIMLVEFNGNKGTGNKEKDSLLSYRIETLQRDIAGEIREAERHLREISSELTTESDNEKIKLLHLEKARQEAITDRLQLLNPAVEDLADRISREDSKEAIRDMEYQLEEYEQLVRSLDKE